MSDIFLMEMTSGNPTTEEDLALKKMMLWFKMDIL